MAWDSTLKPAAPARAPSAIAAPAPQEVAETPTLRHPNAPPVIAIHPAPAVAENATGGVTLRGKIDTLQPGVTRAQDYDDAFTRTSGWTGADGTYSVTLPSGETLWLFSDTLIGTVDEAGYRALDTNVAMSPNGGNMLNNSLALQPGKDPSKTEFLIDKNPTHAFEPPDKVGWFWANDATVLGPDKVGVLLSQFIKDSDPRFIFGKVQGLWRATVQVKDGRATVTGYKRLEGFEGRPGDETVWGAAALPADGYVYLYGARNPHGTPPSHKEVVVARARADTDVWEFFDGEDWSPQCAKAAAVGLSMSNEASVDQLRDGTFVMITTNENTDITMRFAREPQGPWSAPEVLFQTPENTKTVITYNSKAHLSLSDERGLLISYNVNSFDPHESFHVASIYRPRFLRLAWPRLEAAKRRALPTDSDD